MFSSSVLENLKIVDCSEAKVQYLYLNHGALVQYQNTNYMSSINQCLWQPHQRKIKGLIHCSKKTKINLFTFSLYINLVYLNLIKKCLIAIYKSKIMNLSLLSCRCIFSYHAMRASDYILCKNISHDKIADAASAGIRKCLQEHRNYMKYVLFSKNRILLFKL